MLQVRGSWFAAWSTCASLVACTAAPPAGDKQDPPNAETKPAPKQLDAQPAPPEPTKVVDPTPPAKPPPPVAEPEPEGDPDKTPYPPGIVPEHEELLGLTWAKAAEFKPDPPLLAQVDKCTANPDECDYSAGVLGFHKDGRIAVIEAPKQPSCGAEFDPLNSWGRVGKEGAHTKAPQVKFKPGPDDERGARAAASFVDAQAKAGFEAPADIVAFTGGGVNEIRGFTDLAGLKAPLLGWMVHAIVDGKSATVRLVDPTNKVAHVLGKVPANGSVPSIEQVALNPAGTHLYVTLSLNNGEHCGSDPVAIHRWPLPAGVTPTP